MAHSDFARATVAALLWHANQGNLNRDDRAVSGMDGHNFVAKMSLHPDDRAALPHWLMMADEVLDAIDTELT